MTLTNYNIEQLVELCKNDNQHAQLEIYNRFYKAMYNTSYRIVKDSFKAEDIMQDSFLTAFTKLSSIKDSKTFASWLKRIVVNNSIYQYQKNVKKNEIAIENVEYKLEQVSEESNNNDYTSLQAKEVIQAMNELNDKYRLILNLNLIEGFDYEEICEIMNISYANCRTLISRAKNKLKETLEQTVIN